MNGFAKKASPIAEKIWAPCHAASSGNREFGHKHLRAIAIGAILGLALGAAATAESGNAADEERANAGVVVELGRPSPSIDASSASQIDSDADRDTAHIKRVRARGAIYRGALTEAEVYLDEAGELDPEAPMLPVLRRLIDLSKSRLEMG